MSTTAALFARWIAAKGYTSERQALKALNLSPGAAVHWKAGRNADADVIEKMATDLGENAHALVAQAMAEQAKGPAARTWTRIAKRLAAAAITLMIVPVAHPAAQAADRHSAGEGTRHYAKSGRVRRWVARVRRWIGMQVALLLAPSSIEARS